MKLNRSSKPQHRRISGKGHNQAFKKRKLDDETVTCCPARSRMVRDRRLMCMGVCTRHTWDAVNLHASLLKVLKLLTAAAKDVGIATLEPHNCSVVLRKLTQELMDLILCPRMEGALFAHIHHPGAIVYELQDVSRDQPATKGPMT